jgi:GNAT superfamily N-acetyltransferase
MALASVRAATPADVEEIIRIQTLTWRTAYAELVPEAAVQRLSGPAARRAWHEAVTAGGGNHVLVAAEGEWTVGFCAATGADDPDEPDVANTAGDPVSGDPLAADLLVTGAHGLIVTLLVEPRWGRRGHGERLFEAAITALRADGATVGAVWVPEKDVASRAFFDRRGGWEADGMVRVLDAGDRELREIRLVGPLEMPVRQLPPGVVGMDLTDPGGGDL